MAKKVRIADRWVGEGEPVFIIGEADANQNGHRSIAKHLIDAFSETGADQVTRGVSVCQDPC